MPAVGASDSAVSYHSLQHVFKPPTSLGLEAARLSRKSPSAFQTRRETPLSKQSGLFCFVLPPPTPFFPGGPLDRQLRNPFAHSCKLMVPVVIASLSGSNKFMVKCEKIIGGGGIFNEVLGLSLYTTGSNHSN